MESHDANAANSIKKFKSQSLNSLFRKSVNSASASPAPGSVDKSGSPKDPNASLSSNSTPKKAVTSLSTATGAFKLAAMKRDKASASPSASSNNSPRAENATVWKKQEKDEDMKPATAVSSTSSSLPSTVASHASESLSPQSKLQQPRESQDHKSEGHSKDPRDLDDEELLKKGINIAQRLSLSEAVNREFNWDDDDGDEEWQPSPELALKAQEAMEASKPAPKPAPWSMNTQERTAAVSIGDQIKELSEKKSQRHHAPQIQFQNVPHYNYRMPPAGQGSWNNEHDVERERYRYHDHEQRYRSNEPPRPELFNASSGQLELIDEQRFRSRRFSNNRSISPQSWRRGPSQEERDQRQHEIEERQREVAEKLLKKREDENKKEEEERQRQKEYMVQAREAARRRKEEELQREEERKVAARKKADEVAARMDEKARKLREAKARKEQEVKQAKDEQIKRKQEDLAKQKQVSTDQQLKKAPPTAPAAHRAAVERRKDVPIANHKGLRERSESIDETQVLEAVRSVLDDDDKIWSGSSSAGSRSGGSGGSSSSKLWSQPNRSQNDIGVWGSVQAVTNRFSSELGRKEDLFTSKDDLAVKNDQVWKSADWRPSSHKSQPVTPSTSLNTPENRTSSRFFPSPKFENGVSWNGSPKMHRDSLVTQGKFPMNSAISRTRSSPAQDDLSELPRVVLPPIDSASSAAVARPPQPRLPQPIRPSVGGPQDQSAGHTVNSIFNPSPVLPQLESTQIDTLLLTGFEATEPQVSLPDLEITEELCKFELFPEIPSEERGNEQLIAHLSHYRDKLGRLHRREYEIDYGRPLHMWLIRLPGSPKRTLLTKDKHGKITVGEPPKRPQHQFKRRA